MRGSRMLGAMALVAAAAVGWTGTAGAYCTPGDATCERLEGLGKDRSRRTMALPEPPADRRQQRYEKALKEYGHERAGERTRAEQEAWEAAQRKPGDAPAAGLRPVLPEERAAAAAGEAAAREKEGEDKLKKPAAVVVGPAGPRKGGPPVYVFGKRADGAAEDGRPDTSPRP
jgi:hypothetical protein